MDSMAREVLRHGVVIPAHPLAIDARRRLDERRQRTLSRYYIASGAGGIAVGVHTTQFAIREHGLYRPVLEISAQEAARGRARDRVVGGSGGSAAPGSGTLVLVAGAQGPTRQAVEEAEIAHGLGYHAALLGLGALHDATEDVLIDHCRAVAGVLPLFGFYLQPAVGGRVLPYSFWRRFAEIEAVVAVKIAPFDRYRTLHVVRAIVDSGRDDIALYTGNDDAIVLDLLVPYRFQHGEATVERRIVGGLLGHWAVWTRSAVRLLEECRAAVNEGSVPVALLRRAAEVTDANSALFDAANGFRGCIAGIHEILRREGLLEGTWCLDPDESLGPGQMEEIDRVCRAYPHLSDADFIAGLPAT